MNVCVPRAMILVFTAAQPVRTMRAVFRACVAVCACVVVLGAAWDCEYVRLWWEYAEQSFRSRTEVAPRFPMHPVDRPIPGPPRIPRIVHFVFGMKADFGGKPFGILSYVAVRSAFVMLRPHTIMFHYVHEPSGFFWERAKPMLTLRRVEPVTHIGEHAVTHVAHMADWIRLQVLKTHGGVYHDLDVITLRPYPGDWWTEPFVMGLQDTRGLCNAVMMSVPDAEFIALWQERYVREFDQDDWDGLSVRLPLRLALDHPAAVYVLPKTAWFYPSWWDKGRMFEYDGWDWREHADQYAHHIAETGVWDRHIRDLTVGQVFAVTTGFHRMMRPFLGNVSGV